MDDPVRLAVVISILFYVPATGYSVCWIKNTHYQNTHAENEHRRMPFRIPLITWKFT